MDILTKVQLCEKHGKKLDYYCFEGERRTPVCTQCLETDYKGHDFKEIKQIKEQEKEVWEKLDNWEMNVNIEGDNHYFLKDYALQKFSKDLEKLRRKGKEEIESLFEEQLSAQSSKLKLLHDFQENVHDGTKIS